MKAGKLITLAALAFLAAPAMVRADDAAPAKNWSFTVGVKGWVDTWDTSLARYDIEGGNQVSVRSSNEISGIPFVSVGFHQWRFVGSYNLQTSYDFGNYNDVFDIGGSSYYENVATKAKRKEWDINAGYAFNPHFMLTVGYKQVDKELTSVRTSPGFTFFENPTRRQKVSGPTIGIAVNGDITGGGRIKIYGAGAIGFMTQQTDRAASTDTVYCPSYGGTNIYCNSAHFSENQSYENLESGFLFVPKPGLGLAITLGYRYQVITGNDRAQNSSSGAAAFSFKSTDITRGPTFGISYTF